MEWQTPLSGDAADLENLAKDFTGAELAIVKGSAGFYLTSTAFGPMDPRGVRDKAEDFIAQLNGVAKLQYEAYTPLKLAGVQRRREDGTCDVFAFPPSIAGRSRVVGRATALRDGVPMDLGPPIASQWMEKAAADDEVARLLRFLARNRRFRRCTRLRNRRARSWWEREARREGVDLSRRAQVTPAHCLRRGGARKRCSPRRREDQAT